MCLCLGGGGGAGGSLPALVRADAWDRQLICDSGYAACGGQMFCTSTGKSLVQISVLASTLKISYSLNAQDMIAMPCAV